MPKILHHVSKLWHQQPGITGLETAVVLIAFVVVASVFAFAALSMGLFTSDKAKETIRAGLDETRGTMELKGSIIATAASTGNSGIVSSLTFQIANAAASEGIDVSVGNTVLRYFDNNNAVTLDTAGDFTSTGLGSSDGDAIMDPGETFEISIPNMDTFLSTGLGADQSFTIEVIPPKGAVLHIERTTPISLEPQNNLQ